MSASQRNKGHTYERKIANFYRELGFDVRRGAQAHEAVEPDICVRTGVFPWWVECAHYAKGGLVFRKFKQAKEDLGWVQGKQPVVVHVHEDGGADLVVISLEHWKELNNGNVHADAPQHPAR